MALAALTSLLLQIQDEHAQLTKKPLVECANTSDISLVVVTVFCMNLFKSWAHNFDHYPHRIKLNYLREKRSKNDCVRITRRHNEI